MKFFIYSTAKIFRRDIVYKNIKYVYDSPLKLTYNLNKIKPTYLTVTKNAQKKNNKKEKEALFSFFFILFFFYKKNQQQQQVQPNKIYMVYHGKNHTQTVNERKKGKNKFM